MKKICLLLLLTTLFVACGGDDDNNDPNEGKYFPLTDWAGDWNDPDDDAYKEEYEGKYRPMWGVWKVEKINGKEYTDYLVYCWTSEFTWESTTKRPDNGDRPYFRYPYKGEKFYVNDKMIKTDKRLYKYEIKIVNDDFEMTLTDGADTWLLRYYVGEGSVWLGDWNDPDDRYYQIFQGNYNPVKGTWKMTHIDGKPTTPSYYRFNEDFVREVAGSSNHIYYDATFYQINKTGIRLMYKNGSSTYIEYSINDNTLIYDSHDSANVLTFVKIED
ncbi:hypothetical protein D0T53_09215 [Dysgonomonas sp. 216]|uniref:hypothetical protein n=1 Tax=Dysgonomonas sp. 216 TaxID=2302934 RepID=UPI0013D2C07D|nr:hypothetical protein [Dysgonomonas sp. 216]NDW19091.1 hypothetical protein [Dysgonomonas sp. 216]